MLRVGLVDWNRQASNSLHSAISKTILDLGHHPLDFRHNDSLPQCLDVVLAFGPFGSLKKVVDQIQNIPESERPIFALWLTEPLPNPDLPRWLWTFAGSIYSYINPFLFQLKKNRLEDRLKLRSVALKFKRFSRYGLLLWLRAQDVLSVLAVGSKWNADLLRNRGFNPLTAYIGYHPDWTVDEEPERDIDVLWIGWPGSKRRRRILQKVQAELAARDIRMEMFDVVQNPYCTGVERARVLKRSKIVLNLMKKKWDSNTFRFYLAAANRCLMVTEPMLPHCVLTPGIHLIETSLEQMPETISYFLKHDDERKKIADNGHHLVTNDLTMRNAVGTILSEIMKQK